MGVCSGGGGGGGGGMSIKTLYGGSTDFKNQHIRYKNETLKNKMMSHLNTSCKIRKNILPVKTYLILLSGP